MSKTSLGLAAALLAALAALLHLRRGDAEAAAAYPDRAFAVDDPDAIGRIFLADMRGRTLDLVRRGDDTWWIGDSLAASPSIMAQVVDVLAKVSVDFIPPAATVATIEEGLRTNALKIAVYDRGGRQLRSLLLGPSTKDERNSYMLVEGQRQPYAVRIPGHTGGIRPLFDLRSVDAWRSLEFVAVEPDDILAARVEYPRRRGAGFVVRRGAGGFAVVPADPLVPPLADAPDQRLAESYLEGFADVALFDRTTGWDGADSLRATEPHARITLALDGGDTSVITLWPRYLRDARGNQRVDEPVPSYFVDRDGELVRVQTQQLRPWLRGYEAFFR